MAYGKTKMGKKLNPTTEPGDDKRRYIDPRPDVKGRIAPIPKPPKPAPPKFRPKLPRGAR